MVSLEQVKLLDSKVSRLIGYISKANEENTQLKERLDSYSKANEENTQLKERLNTYQKRIDELENFVKQFKQEQGRIEDGILSALDRLNQFEDALESKLSTENKLPAESKLPTEAAIPAETAPASPAKAEQQKKEAKNAPGSDIEPLIEEEQSYDSGELDIF
jgi:predicted  nucleic acid-binding Zn-ribbon protein